jgi:ABC-type molybdate transport system ATPase subunit
VSSPLLDDVVRWADRILVLDEGRIAFHGDLEDFWTEAHRRGVPGRDGELAFLALTRSRA